MTARLVLALDLGALIALCAYWEHRAQRHWEDELDRHGRDRFKRGEVSR